MEEILVGDLKTNYYARLCLWTTEVANVYELTEFLYAPGRGRELFEEVSKAIQDLADLKGIVIKHHYNATNLQSLNLIKIMADSHGYIFIKVKQVENEEWYLYEKIYCPGSNQEL